MWYHPAAFFVDKRDVIGAWLICVAIAIAFFGYPAVTAALDPFDRGTPVYDHLSRAGS